MTGWFGALLRSEWRKIRSTRTGLLFGIGLVLADGLALTLGLVQSSGADASTSSPAQLARDAGGIYTSGQYFGGLFVALMAILMITNEYYHQTATATFLATPRRARVIVAKFVAAVLMAVAAWAFTTLLNVAIGAPSLAGGAWLRSPAVAHAIGVNLMMYVLWAVFGIGLGALIRSQNGATVTQALMYTTGYFASYLIFEVLYAFVWTSDTMIKGMVLVPGVAAQIAEGSEFPLPNDVRIAPGVGVAVMLAYGVVMAVVGTWRLRSRDVA
jgi:ABC-2 type transport system permease protein